MKKTTSIEPYIRKKILESILAHEPVETMINKTEYFLYYAFMTNWLSWVMASATSGFYKTQKVTFFWDKTWVLCAAYVISSIIGIFMPDIDMLASGDFNHLESERYNHYGSGRNNQSWSIRKSHCSF